jgi:hypothetical protein
LYYIRLNNSDVLSTSYKPEILLLVLIQLIQAKKDAIKASFGLHIIISSINCVSGDVCTYFNTDSFVVLHYGGNVNAFGFW